MKKKIDTKEKSAQVAQAAKVVQQATDLLNQTNGQLFIVGKLEAGANTKVFFTTQEKCNFLNGLLNSIFYHAILI